MSARRIFLAAAAALVLASCGAAALPPIEQPPLSSDPAGPIAPPIAASPLERLEIFSETLPNGFRIVLAKTPLVPGQEPRAYVGSYIFHGVMQEERPGWAHLMEHVVANNRSAIPGPPIPKDVKFFNGNALARPYYTSFVLIAPPSIAAAITHGRMAKAGMTANDPAVFTEELGRVIAELERDSSSQYAAYSALAALSLGARPGVAAEIESVRSASLPSVEAMIRKHYRPEAAALVVVGDIDVDQVRAAILAAAAKLGWSHSRAPVRLQGARVPLLLTGRSAVLAGQNKGERAVVGLAWPRPGLASSDQMALLIADQLLLGGHDDPRNPKRSDSSPLGRRLGASLQASELWDRIDNWATPPLAETGPALQPVIFNTDREPAPAKVQWAVEQALREIRRSEMSDADIDAAKARLAEFYEGWLFEPDYRILGDHLIAYYASGLDAERVKDIPLAIRRTSPAQVRAAFDRYLLAVRPNVVVLPGMAAPAAKSE